MIDPTVVQRWQEVDNSDNTTTITANTNINTTTTTTTNNTNNNGNERYNHSTTSLKPDFIIKGKVLLCNCYFQFLTVC
ncbi:unnamed protein product [Trichobilharzia regenti]|nr:unnamed protein product [Trichobilharzia regenti]